jgi:hypothetical protein
VTAPLSDGGLAWLRFLLDERNAGVSFLDDRFTEYIDDFDILPALLARLDAAEGALRWYADPANYTEESDYYGGMDPSMVQLDRGERARAALPPAGGA